MANIMVGFTRSILGRYNFIGGKMSHLWGLSVQLAKDPVVCIHRDGIGPILSVADAKKLISPPYNHNPADAFDIHLMIKNNHQLFKFGDRIYFETNHDAGRVRNILRLLGRSPVSQAKAQLSKDVFFFRDASEFPPGYSR